MQVTTDTPSTRFRQDRIKRRRAVDRIMTALLVLGTVIALVPLFAVGAWVVQQGWPALIGHWPSVLTEVSPAGGQLIQGLEGTLILVALACVVGLPIGIFSGIYLAEYGHNRFGDAVRFVTDVIAGLPSIVAGIVAYSLLVLTTKHFNAFAGGLALGLLMFPTVTRSTEGVIRLVPDALREGSLALGVRRWRTIVSVVIPAALSGIVTGIILGIARVAGETAPLLFTVLGNSQGFVGLMQPLPALPLQIFVAVTSPVDPSLDYPIAFAGVMLLFLLVLILNLLARWIAARSTVA